MVEFLQNYGLWIALGGVFVVMHWFGMGCCGGHRRQQSELPPGSPREASGAGPKEQGDSDPAQRTSQSCH